MTISFYEVKKPAQRFGFLVDEQYIWPMPNDKARKIPVAGAAAEVIHGATQRRTTATRVAVGSLLAPGLGTAIGAMARKATDTLYVIVTAADGQELLSRPVKAKDERDARQWVSAFNAAAKRLAEQ